MVVNTLCCEGRGCTAWWLTHSAVRAVVALHGDERNIKLCFYKETREIARRDRRANRSRVSFSSLAQEANTQTQRQQSYGLGSYRNTFNALY